MKKINLKSKNIRFGGYQTIVAIVVIAIAIAINVIFSGLNISVDLTEENLFSLSDKTVEVVKSVNDPVNIYVLTETGNETVVFKELLTRYDKLSSNVSVIYKDPTLYPQFTKKYLSDEITQINTGSLIIDDEATGKYKVLTPDDLSTIENDLTSAISYVVTTENRILYTTTGHGELSLPSALSKLIASANMSVQSISLLSEDLGEPSTSTLLIYSPHSDLNDSELAKITSFMDAGGKAMIFTDYDTPELKNFNQLLSYYGVQQTAGIIVETSNSNMYNSIPNVLIPIYTQHDITNSLENNKLLLIVPNASALRQTANVRNGLTITPLISTSDDAFLKTDLESATTEKAAGDIDGPFDLAYAIEETNSLDSSNVITTRLVVLSDSYLIDDSRLNLSATGNETFITNCLNWLQNDDSTSFAIEGKAYNDYSLPAISGTQFLSFTGIAVILIPLIIIVSGIIVLIRRKNM